MAKEDDQADTTMTTTAAAPKTRQKYHELASHTIRAPPYAYAHLELYHPQSHPLPHSHSPPHPHPHPHPQSQSPSASPHPAEEQKLDALQAKTYCAAALRQFLGATGAAVAGALDVLHVDAARGACVVRVPRDDLAAFAAAVTAWQGVAVSDSGEVGGGGRATLRIIGCSDWLGTLLGRQSEERLWASG